ncbi:hypothetical protein [Brumimicrobium aurantiacum]|uniref:Uncharacterized protein n=1 Tax=Brumimicrobium aurantiacum TaxID=1737063 RepID=A0A3E1EVV4_9FLAO|nr:hypothetical protein [Brumimicrobium aurantiacum]RFC53694.1 hypothetical protein DXU93_11230 [Brumimicrobium aurantiacum]
MKNIIITGALLLILVSCGTSGNLFPKKYLGEYQGVQESYELSMNGEPVTVPETQYELLLDYHTLWMTTPRQKIEASYELKAETDMYYALLVEIESGVIEEWQLWKKGEKLIRKSIAPQPDVIFVAE